MMTTFGPRILAVTEQFVAKKYTSLQLGLRDKVS
jgi:hypothetical protein